jgi:hypothetical protein
MLTYVNETEAPPLQPASVSACRQCGYLLVGLPVEGFCPECGQSFNRWTLIAFGIASGSTANDFNAGAWRLTFSVLLSLFLVLNFWSTLRHGNLAMLLLIPMILLVPAVSMIRRFNLQQPGTVRLRISAHGCAQDDLTTLPRGQRVAIALFGIGISVGIMVWGLWRESALFVIPPIVVAVVVVALRRGRRARRRRTGISSSLTYDGQNSYVTRSARWLDVQSVSITKAGAERWRVRAHPLLAPYEKRCAIDAVITAAPEQIDALREFAAQFTRVVAK